MFILSTYFKFSNSGSITVARKTFEEVRKFFLSYKAVNTLKMTSIKHIFDSLRMLNIYHLLKVSD